MLSSNKLSKAHNLYRAEGEKNAERIIGYYTDFEPVDDDEEENSSG